MNEAGGDYFTKVSKGTARGREADGVFTGGNGENRGLTSWNDFDGRGAETAAPAVPPYLRGATAGRVDLFVG